ncbi:hypothetical protein BACOV975_03168 [Bacteroides ovatus V975]|uniref:Uncharacterized protein n=1 Tax=Bacteroides ovatus (strain ATCC 8483 / DSM 1896 / JCM 5824 / BCRC 10623 / CCUG 4943 / NCTC 11153) TaxID=411476 RepID=A0AAN3D883_BACO1|nr:hypothetical protein BACOVA_03876 [Bacteroides ovatus ATCC 8483]SCV09374.1 hypothetical protein BACOV975_03168 [Bacteroides ovatus V975]DAZ39334.1 MAG TPA: hypothetical protein [Caudoviricetes sp.]
MSASKTPFYQYVKELFSVVPSLPSRAGSKTGLGTG